jgi:hypothetical protein
MVLLGSPPNSIIIYIYIIFLKYYLYKWPPEYSIFWLFLISEYSILWVLDGARPCVFRDFEIFYRVPTKNTIFYLSAGHYTILWKLM